MKRPAESGSVARSALGDVTKSSVNVLAADEGCEGKRQKIGAGGLGTETAALNA